MAYYRITITRFDENPNYEKERRQSERERQYSGRYREGVDVPTPYLERNTLATVITEAEVNAVRKALVAAMP